ncbi:hypothetical protein KEM55_001275, partial [Ascosphaera atra]
MSDPIEIFSDSMVSSPCPPATLGMAMIPSTPVDPRLEAMQSAALSSQPLPETQALDTQTPDSQGKYDWPPEVVE